MLVEKTVNLSASRLADDGSTRVSRTPQKLRFPCGSVQVGGVGSDHNRCARARNYLRFWTLCVKRAACHGDGNPAGDLHPVVGLRCASQMPTVPRGSPCS